MRRWPGILPLAAVLVWLSGCASAPIGDPLAVMLDRSRDPVLRLRAAEQLGPIRDAADPKTVADTLQNVLWSDGEPTDLRLVAMDKLIEYDADAFWLIAERRIRELDNWAVLEPLIDRAVDRGDPSFTAILVRSFVRESQVRPDTERPEYDAIAALNPGKTVEQAIWEVLVSDDASVGIAARVDAWTLTNRLSGPDVARDRLMRESSSDPVILDLQAGAWLGRLPSNREGVLWLMELRSPPNRAFWDEAEARAKGLTDAQRQDLELRHLPVLMHVSEQHLKADKPALRSRISGRLPAEPTAIRTSPGVAMQLPGESLAEHEEALCWADLVAIDLLLDAMDDRRITTLLFRQAEVDKADTRTERGGVLVIEHGRFDAVPFKPKLRLHDRKFYSSEELIQRMYTGLFHYHFHVQQYHNAEYAGPGLGDLGFAERLRPSAVVFTFLDRDTLGVDYYQPGGVVLDLGVIPR